MVIFARVVVVVVAPSCSVFSYNYLICNLSDHQRRAQNPANFFHDNVP